jgi:hypothetical protein
MEISWSYLLDEHKQITMPSFSNVCTYLTKSNTLIVFLFPFLFFFGEKNVLPHFHVLISPYIQKRWVLFREKKR